jgi:hypothetical protein
MSPAKILCFSQGPSNLQTMAINWIQNISSSGDLMFPLIDRNGMVLVYSSGVGAVVALEFRTGSIAWRLPLPPLKYPFVLNNEGNALIIHDSSTGDIRDFQYPRMRSMEKPYFVRNCSENEVDQVAIGKGDEANDRTC